ncbi:MAG: hypothetical protein ACK4NF_01615 [Planctomycetota bacterium]
MEIKIIRKKKIMENLYIIREDERYLFIREDFSCRGHLYMCKNTIANTGLLYFSNVFEPLCDYLVSPYEKEINIEPSSFLLLTVCKNELSQSEIEKLVKFQILEDDRQISVNYFENKIIIDYDIDNSLVLLYSLLLLRLLEEESARKNLTNPLKYAFSMNVESKVYTLSINDNVYFEILRKIFRNKNLPARDFMRLRRYCWAKLLKFYYNVPAFLNFLNLCVRKNIDPYFVFYAFRINKARILFNEYFIRRLIS